MWVAMVCSFVGAKILQKMGRALLGRRLALPGPTGQCAFAHSIHLLERPGEVRAAWRALFVPYQRKEQVAVSNEVPFRPFCICKNAQGVWADWVYTFWQQKVKPDQVVVSLLI